MPDEHTPRRRRRCRRSAPETLPDDLYFYLDTANDDKPSEPEHLPRLTRRGASLSKVDPTNWRVIDDWPEKVPITEAEIEVFEHYFADVFDRLFGPLEDPENGLTSLSHSDNEKP